ncbi:amidohydrolase family protein [Brevibacillus sp. B_LB10_24]|uniref:amidohydrolase family protein n=1 Tax=Brevibacillus sp. B_LB10_24 TaxID=3380645 RepID=UPI0038BA6854
MKIDTLVVHADLFTMAGQGVGFIDDGAVAINGNKIVAVGASNELLKDYAADEVIDATGMMVLPGFVDCHMHTSLAIFRGLAQDTNAWMHKGIGPFVPFINEVSELAGSRMNILEALAAGTTTFCDYSSPILDIAAFFKKIGARARLTTSIKEVPPVKHKLKEHDLYPFDPAIGERTLSENLELVERWHGAEDNRITAMLGPQCPDQLSKELMLKVREIAKAKNLKLHMHVAQGDRETKQMLGRYQKRPIAFLDEIGYLDESLIAVHLTDATEEEARYVAKSGASMVVCSGSIGIIDGVVPPAVPFMEAGGTVGLGTDQAAGNNCNQIINEMKLTSLFNKIKYQDPEKLPAWKALRMATIEGARAVGIGDEVGSLESGKKADLIFIDLKAKTMLPVFKTPMRNHVPNLVYSARGHEICRVMVDGKTLYQDGKYLTVDEAEIIADCQMIANQISGSVSEENFAITTSATFMKEGKL